MLNILSANAEIYTLIEKAQKNDIKSLEKLIRLIQKDVFAFFSHLTEKREDIADLTQETLLKIAKNIAQLKNIKYFKTWLNKIAVNVYYDFVRKNQDKLLDFDEKKLEEIKDKIDCEPGTKCAFSELGELIKASLLSLPSSLRLTLVLREFDGLSYEDISKITNTSLGTVKSRISRARFKLQKELKEFI